MSTYFPQEQSHPTYMNQLQLVRASNGQAVAGMVLGILASLSSGAACSPWDWR